MKRWLVPAALVAVGLIHLLPLSGVLGAERLAALYGIDASDANVALLMRHRAVLFGLLGGALLWAAFHPAWHAGAWWAATISVMSFLLLALMQGGLNAAVMRVVVADVAALALLIAAGLARALRARG